MEIERLKRLMVERNLNQLDVAKILQIGPDKVSKIFHGVRKLQLAEANTLRTFFGFDYVSGGSPMLLKVRRFSDEPNEKGEIAPMPSPDPTITNGEWWHLDDDRADRIAPAGDRLLADYDDTELVDDKVYLVELNGAQMRERFVLRYVKRGHRLKSCSTNPAFRGMAATTPGLVILGRITSHAREL